MHWIMELWAVVVCSFSEHHEYSCAWSRLFPFRFLSLRFGASRLCEMTFAKQLLWICLAKFHSMTAISHANKLKTTFQMTNWFSVHLQSHLRPCRMPSFRSILFSKSRADIRVKIRNKKKHAHIIQSVGFKTELSGYFSCLPCNIWTYPWFH